MKKWQCTVCGYVHEGEEPPEKCPACGAGKEMFIELKTSDDTADHEIQPDNAQLMKGHDGPFTIGHSQNNPPTILDKIIHLVVENHLHPISVHTPNGIIPVAVIFVLLAVLTQALNLASAAYLNMIVVLLSMPVVLLTGYVTWQKKYSGVKTSLFKIKIGASCAATAILFGLIFWRTIEPDVLTTASLDRWLFLFWSFLMLALVGLTGHLGGKLVFTNKK